MLEYFRFLLSKKRKYSNMPRCQFIVCISAFTASVKAFLNTRQRQLLSLIVLQLCIPAKYEASRRLYIEDHEVRRYGIGIKKAPSSNATCWCPKFCLLLLVIAIWLRAFQVITCSRKLCAHNELLKKVIDWAGLKRNCFAAFWIAICRYA